MDPRHAMYGLPPFDPAYATAYDDPFAMEDPRDLELRRAQRTAMLD